MPASDARAAIEAAYRARTQGLLGLSPDLTTLGKVIGGGLPVGAFGGRADVMDGFESGRPESLPHSGTFAGNAVVAAAGLAALALLTGDEIARINSSGDRVRAGLGAALAGARIPAQVTGIGSLVGLHFSATPVRDYRSSLRANREAMRWLHLALLNRGLFARAAGAFFLSTALTDPDLREIVEAFSGALDEVLPILAARPV
jgi:glutamate-1-semialdehyde 2,1-aminomutase